ncbi:MAG: cyclic nucleotide-binding domain-containing protein [Geodermatophilaceae bacterium]
MRIESVVTSLTWIPTDSIPGLMKLPFDMGVTRYDEVPPDTLDDLEALRQADRFRFANQLGGCIDVTDGVITDHGRTGGGHMGSTTIRIAGKAMTFAAVAFPDLVPEPQVGADWVRFEQTCGGRTAVPAPRRVTRAPFVQITAPTVWTTLAVTLYADGRTEHELVGASPFPRHWVYGGGGNLTHKSGLMDVKSWSQKYFGEHSPWGDYNSPAVVAEVESQLERRLSTLILSGRDSRRRRIAVGEPLVRQGDPGDELYLLLDGLLAVDVDGEVVAEVGPGAIVGERALLEGGLRTSTLIAVTPCNVAVAQGRDVDRAALTELAEGHRREDA